ncbi:MAG: adenylosuccinate lyase, partial [Opitutaceae bacterium]
GDPDLLGRLAGDRRIGLGRRAHEPRVLREDRLQRAAPHQVDAFLAEVKPLARRHRGAADYEPGRLL